MRRICKRSKSRRGLAQGICLALAALASVATSRRRAASHQPLYMSWKEFRAAVRVLPPRPLENNGKVVVRGDLLLVSEPHRGIHVIDNRDPQSPIPKAYLQVPGNIDLAIRGDYLYADSFVDLLVFRLSADPGNIRLVHRMKHVFPYDPRLTYPRDQFITPGRVDPRKGVIIGWKRIPREVQR